jgi:Domain of unknown function (DUF4411)
VHLFDCNSIGVLENYFPERFPSFWAKFESGIADGSIASVREVSKELGALARTDWIRQRLSRHSNFFQIPEPAALAFVGTIFSVPHFLNLVEQQKRLRGRPVADPFLIACAKVRGWTVVSEEKLKPNAAKIPNVCRHFDVKCTNVEGFLKARGWKF